MRRAAWLAGVAACAALGALQASCGKIASDCAEILDCMDAAQGTGTPGGGPADGDDGALADGGAAEGAVGAGEDAVAGGPDASGPGDAHAGSDVGTTLADARSGDGPGQAGDGGPLQDGGADAGPGQGNDSGEGGEADAGVDDGATAEAGSADATVDDGAAGNDGGAQDGAIPVTDADIAMACGICGVGMCCLTSPFEPASVACLTCAACLAAPILGTCIP